MPDPLQQLSFDVRAIVTEVERLTGLTSNWRGRVVIGTELNTRGLPRYFGGKAWNCDIVLHQSRLLSPSRYSTLIHEAFHSVQYRAEPSGLRRLRWFGRRHCGTMYAAVPRCYFGRGGLAASNGHADVLQFRNRAFGVSAPASAANRYNLLPASVVNTVAGS